MSPLPFVRRLQALGYALSDAQRMCCECDYDERVAVLELITNSAEDASQWN